MMGECWQARRLLLVLFVVLALSVQASPFDGRADGWDDDSGTSKVTAAFEVCPRRPGSRHQPPGTTPM